MLRTTFKALIAHKFRLFTTALAVMLGVGFMAGTFVLTDTVTKTFDDLFANVYKGTDSFVRAKAAFGGDRRTGQVSAQRGRVDASLVDTISRVDGVRVAEGQVMGYARIVGKNGDALGNPATGAPTLGTGWTATKDLDPFTLVAGRAPQADDEVVIDRKSSRDGRLFVGDTTTVLAQGPPLPVRITGIVKFGAADSPGGASFVLFTPATAQRVIAEPGKFDAISIVAAPGVTQSEVTSRIQAVLPPGVEAITGAALTKENQSDMRKAMSFFTVFMFVFAVVALLVGAFIIFNTFSITVAQRTRENALLRALGASKRQVLLSILAEAFVVGVLASLLGLAAGVLVALGLKSLLDALGFGIPGSGVVFIARTAIVSMVAGVGVTVTAAVSPARRGAKVPPMAAMREIQVGSTGYGSKRRIVVGAGLLAVGVSALFAGLFGNVSNGLSVVGVGVLLVFFAVSVLARTVSIPLSRLIGAPLPRLRGIAGALAKDNAMRNPKRTAASASALMIGVGLVGFITIFAASTKASINHAIDQAFIGDFVVDSGGGITGGVDPSFADRLNQTPGIDAATGFRIGLAEVDGSVQIVHAMDPRTATTLVDVKPGQGSLNALDRGALAVSTQVAKDKHWKLGDLVSVTFKDSGPQQLRIALIYGENRLVGNYFIGRDTYDANFATKLDSEVFIRKTPGTSAAAGLAAVQGVARDYPGTKVFDQTGLKKEQAKSVNQMLYLVYALLALAILIALLGIGNTLALSIFERRRELGLLRAVGMTRPQLRTTIRWESVIIALQGALLGLLIGVFFGWALVKALADQGITVFRVPYASLAVVMVMAALAGVVAAILPSRRAAKLNVLRAVISG